MITRVSYKSSYVLSSTLLQSLVDGFDLLVIVWVKGNA